MSDDLIDQVLAFWFADGDDQAREVWFKSTPAFDWEIAKRFGEAHGMAHAGALDGWADTAHGALALVILLDQFPRNLFRGEAAAFASDAKALRIAETAVADGFDRQLTPVQRSFLYLPFEHSEDLANQNTSVRLFEALGDRKKLDFALEHRDIIERFGRFPHRNAALGRMSTAEETEFLEGFDSFG